MTNSVDAGVAELLKAFGDARKSKESPKKETLTQADNIFYEQLKFNEVVLGTLRISIDGNVVKVARDKKLSALSMTSTLEWGISIIARNKKDLLHKMVLIFTGSDGSKVFATIANDTGMLRLATEGSGGDEYLKLEDFVARAQTKVSSDMIKCFTVEALKKD